MFSLVYYLHLVSSSHFIMETETIGRKSSISSSSTLHQLFYFLQLLHGFEARKTKQLALGTVLIFSGSWRPSYKVSIGQK